MAFAPFTTFFRFVPRIAACIFGRLAVCSPLNKRTKGTRIRRHLAYIYFSAALQCIFGNSTTKTKFNPTASRNDICFVFLPPFLRFFLFLFNNARSFLGVFLIHIEQHNIFRKQLSKDVGKTNIKKNL